jgi:hypothetical protein
MDVDFVEIGYSVSSNKIIRKRKAVLWNNKKGIIAINLEH